MRKFKLLFVCFGVLGLANVATPVFGGASTCPASGKLQFGPFQKADDDEFIWSSNTAYNGMKGKFSGKMYEFKGKVWECGGSNGCKGKSALKAPAGAFWKGQDVGGQNFWCDEGAADSWEKLNSCTNDRYNNIVYSDLKTFGGGAYVVNGGKPCVVSSDVKKCLEVGNSGYSKGFFTYVSNGKCVCSGVKSLTTGFDASSFLQVSGWIWKGGTCVKISAGNGGDAKKSNNGGDAKKGNNGGDAKKGNNSGGAKKSSGNNNNSQYKIPKENCTCKKKNHTCFVEAEGCELQQKGEWVCNKDYDGYDCCYCKGGNKAKKETSNNNKKKKSNNKDSKDDDNNSNNSSTKNQTGDLVAYSCIEHDSDLGAFSVFFGNAEYSRDDTCKNEIIERVTPFLNQVNKTACVYIVGYADSRNSSGNPNLNAKLSRDRTAWVRGLFSSYDAKFRESEAAGDASYTDKISKRYTSEPQQRRVDIIYGQCIENNKAKQNCHEMMAQGKAVRWDDEQQNCVCKQEGYALNAQGECVEILDVAKKREEEALAAARSESRARIISAGRTLDSIKAGFDISVWKNKDGGFNTARLASDGIAGVVLGTAGGLITSNVIKKNQIKGGFEDIKCTIGGQTVADWGDEFQAGISLNGNY